jgi:hypothetical protein
VIKYLATILISLLMLAAPAVAEQSVSVGGGHSTGHTYSSDNSANSEYALRLTYSIGNFGLMYTHTPDSPIGLFYGQSKLDLTEYFQPFIIIGVGGDKSGVLAGFGVGAVLWVSDSWALVPEFDIFVGSERNYKQTTLSIKYTF